MKKLLTLLAGAVFIVLAGEQLTEAAVLGTEDFTISGGKSDIFTDFKPTLAIAPASVGPGPESSAPRENLDIIGQPSVRESVCPIEKHVVKGCPILS